MSAPYIISKYVSRRPRFQLNLNALKCTCLRSSNTNLYTLYRSLDPVFAIGIGLAAAGIRIRREEREKGHSMNETLEAGKRRLSMLVAPSRKPTEPRKGAS